MGRMRETISRNPVLGPAARSAKRWVTDVRLNPSRSHSVIDVVGQMPAFAPSSYGSYSALANLTIDAVNDTVPGLLSLLDEMGRPAVPESSLNDFCAQLTAAGDPALLKELFDRHGSDKARTHDYHEFYAAVLGDPGDVSSILEVGIGTNHRDVVSSMGTGAHPGASLRAFRDYAPTAEVIGADIDERILFTENRIRTLPLDQTNVASWSRLENQLGDLRFDLVIDDGLHAPHANIRTLTFGLGHLRSGGWVVVEDIARRSRGVWRLVGRLIQSEEYRPFVVDTRSALIFAVQKVT